jgi:hypothetical protein
VPAGREPARAVGGNWGIGLPRNSVIRILAEGKQVPLATGSASGCIVHRSHSKSIMW